MTSRPFAPRLFAALASFLLVGGLAACGSETAEDTVASTATAAAEPADATPIVDPAPVETSAEG